MSSTDGVTQNVYCYNRRPVPSTAATATPRTFATRWLQPSVAVITAHGELDASNAQDFVDYALRARRSHSSAWLLDLSGVDFFGTAGFSALHTLNVRCAARGSSGCSVPSAAVTPAVADLRSGFGSADRGHDVALRCRTLQADQRRLLQLVSEPR